MVTTKFVLLTSYGLPFDDVGVRYRTRLAISYFPHKNNETCNCLIDQFATNKFESEREKKLDVDTLKSYKIQNYFN